MFLVWALTQRLDHLIKQQKGNINNSSIAKYIEKYANLNIFMEGLEK